MVKNYLRVLQRLTSFDGEKATLQEYFAAIGLGLGIVVTFILIVTIIAYGWKIPEKLANLVVADMDKKLKELSADVEQSVQVSILMNKINKTKLACRIIFSGVYVTIALPTVLFIIDVALGIV